MAKNIMIKMQMIAIVIFAIIGGILSVPCMCTSGTVIGKLKPILFLGILLHHGQAIKIKKFKFVNFGVYSLIYLFVCIVTDPHSYY